MAPLPLERSFLKRWVPISCCSGEVEKIIWVISSEMTPPCIAQRWRFVKNKEKNDVTSNLIHFVNVNGRQDSAISSTDWFIECLSSYHDWIHVVSLGLQVATIGHPIILWDTIILHCGNIPPLKKLQYWILTLGTLAGHNFVVISSITVICLTMNCKVCP